VAFGVARPARPDLVAAIDDRLEEDAVDDGAPDEMVTLGPPRVLRGDDDGLVPRIRDDERDLVRRERQRRDGRRFDGHARAAARLPRASATEARDRADERREVGRSRRSARGLCRLGGLGARRARARRRVRGLRSASHDEAARHDDGTREEHVAPADPAS
jgi:hypothetical protein